MRLIRAIAILLLCVIVTWLGGCARTSHSSGPGEVSDTVLPHKSSNPHTVYVQPLESGRSQPLGARRVRKEAVDDAVSAIEGRYKVKVVVLPTKPLPDSAYYKPRRRYRAEKLLSALEGMMPSGEDKIVGLTEVDISTTKGEYPDWGIFGLGNMPGQACVVSTWRLSSRKSQQTFRKRLGKVVVHELGHTFGLGHCPVRGCLMEDAQGRISTVDRENGFCESCRERLREVLR